MNDESPPRPDPVEPEEIRHSSFRSLILVTIVTNALLATLLLLGLALRPRGCPGGCAYHPAAAPLTVVLILLDAGLVLLWSVIGHGYTRDLGERIGERIASRTSKRSSGPGGSNNER